VQLLSAGLSRDEIAHRLEIGTLTRVHRGVYRVGHTAPSVEADYLAAVFAAGPGALLCGRAAAYVQALIRYGPPPPEVMGPVKRTLKGVITHRVGRIEARTLCKRIPVTPVPLTLVALAKDLDDEDLARACHEAGVRYGTTPRHVEAVLVRQPGAAKLRRIIAGDTPVVLSKLEKGFLRRLRRAGLPLPRTNRKLDEGYVDCRWPGHQLTVELDSYRFHSSRYSWEDGYRRERAARARGEEHRRFNWTDVFDEPQAMLADLRRLTACAGSSTA
jgi:hypothetical protein